MYRADHRGILLRTGNGKYLRVCGVYCIGVLAHATGYDNPAIFVESFADSIQGFSTGAINKSAGIDHDYVRVVIAW